jgi:hypothetical protein
MDSNEAMYRFHRAVDRMRSDGGISDPLDRVFRYLYESIRQRPTCPPGVVAALRIVESLTRQMRIFQTEGRVSATKVKWDLVKALQGPRPDWKLVELEIDPVRTHKQSSGFFLGRIWRERIQRNVIPYDLPTRKAVLRHLWNDEAMKRHLAQWESRLAVARSK